MRTFAVVKSRTAYAAYERWFSDDVFPRMGSDASMDGEGRSVDASDSEMAPDDEWCTSAPSMSDEGQGGKAAGFEHPQSTPGHLGAETPFRELPTNEDETTAEPSLGQHHLKPAIDANAMSSDEADTQLDEEIDVQALETAPSDASPAASSTHSTISNVLERPAEDQPENSIVHMNNDPSSEPSSGSRVVQSYTPQALKSAISGHTFETKAQVVEFIKDTAKKFGFGVQIFYTTGGKTAQLICGCGRKLKRTAKETPNPKLRTAWTGCKWRVKVYQSADGLIGIEDESVLEHNHSLPVKDVPVNWSSPTPVEEVSGPSGSASLDVQPTTATATAVEHARKHHSASISSDDVPISHRLRQRMAEPKSAATVDVDQMGSATGAADGANRPGEGDMSSDVGTTPAKVRGSAQGSGKAARSGLRTAAFRRAVYKKVHGPKLSKPSKGLDESPLDGNMVKGEASTVIMPSEAPAEYAEMEEQQPERTIAKSKKAGKRRKPSIHVSTRQERQSSNEEFFNPRGEPLPADLWPDGGLAKGERCCRLPEHLHKPGGTKFHPKDAMYSSTAALYRHLCQ
ncbi:hypothetical protein HDV00_004968 [Rhizophlyctis rosea]|nr:hypothetical protein HDV00_004968 [Rhizophlyctis rosea]